MTTLSTEIEKIISAAAALDAPLFSADWMLKTAKIIEATYPQGAATLTADTRDLDEDLKILRLGAEASWAFIASPFLPNALAAYRESDEGNQRIIAAHQICKKYGASPT